MDSEDFLSDSLETLYDYAPITRTTAGSMFTYTRPDRSSELVLRTPDTDSANWSLHASAIWVSAIYLADHIEELQLDEVTYPLHVLELGAGAGLPSILIAKSHPGISVTVSDYPDADITRTLIDNVSTNTVTQNCRVSPYAWGEDASNLLPKGQPGFDIVLAADTLWNPDLRDLFLCTLSATLKKTSSARIHLIAGMHTGRYTIQSVLEAAEKTFRVNSIEECEVKGVGRRQWDVSRAEDEDERERRRWVVWITLAWPSGALQELAVKM